MSRNVHGFILAVLLTLPCAPAFAAEDFDTGRALVRGSASELDGLRGDPELVIRQEMAAASVIEATPEKLAELAASGYRLTALPDRHRLVLRGGAIDVRDYPLTLKDLPFGSERAPFIVAFDGMPIEAWKTALRQAGADVVGPIPPAGFLVRADAAAVEAIATRPEVLGVVAYRPEWKLSGRIPPGPLPATVEVTTFAGAAVERLETKAAGLGRVLRRYSLLSRSALTVEIDRGALLELAKAPEVEWIDVFPKAALYNNAMRVVMQTDKQHFQANQAFYNPIYAIGVWGASQTVTVADSGVITGHEVYLNPAPPKIASYTLAPCVSGPGDLGDHGTSVASVLAGDKIGATAYGTANDYDGLGVRSQLIIQDFDDDFGPGCMPNDPAVMVTQYFYPAFLAGSMIHNDSWGHGGDTNQGTGTYSPISELIDLYLADWTFREQLLVFAAGNGGALYPGPPIYFPYSTSDESHAKNVVAVGGSDNGSNRHLMYTYSSRGPTNDCGVPRSQLPCPELGRIKPDVVAPGVTIQAATAWPVAPYRFRAGTSFAAPGVAAAAALIRDYFVQGLYPNDPSDPPLLLPTQPSAALVKAMLVNSTVFLSDTNAFESVNQWGLIADAYPNYDQGYGRPVLDNVLEPAGYRELKVFEDATTWFTTSGEAPWERTVPFTDIWGATCNTLRVTLAWADPPMTMGAGRALVNDLDLEVDWNGATWRGNHLLTGGAVPDTLNNVEDVLITMGQVTGPLPQPTVRVLPTSVPQGFQPFSVVVTYGACFDNIPCGATPPSQPGGCYRGPQDVVPQPGPPPPPACWEQSYFLGEYSGGDPFPRCTPPVPCPDSDRTKLVAAEECQEVEPLEGGR